ncbi:GAF domain-containing protein [Mycobacterium crocinum]|uniref:GAF domain-containing protein n=1 Tax=Mycolicibacterium crocinum TaxID=388459 RepID=A0ABY3TKJ6_9MYCO|nr:helix-turn-helix domain-containing protein [Mycolicibacterium crocinum]MCV7215882.1 GAF domain-containing protein [Mycolicibacterium crocinum]ULN40836.1 GAF domain-containing protein [Mycolicibacterium crocinum]
MEASRTPRTGASGPRRSSVLRAVHELFVAGEVDASYLESSSLRPIVAKSWQRSLAKGVDPDGAAQPSPVGEKLARLRETHPLAPALPVIRRLLVDDAAGTGVLVAVSGADGTLLWVEGDSNACRRAEAMNFVPGADWSERGAGTNAPGTALALDAELQIHGSEHFTRVVQPWSCTAVPVHDPVTGALLGALDLTGGSRVATPQALALVRATVVAVETHLALLRLTGGPVEAAPPRPRLAVLGSERPRWLVTDEFGHLRASTLTGRHADILVLLSRHPEGLSADHLAMLLDDKDLDVVTVRAEMSRLRKVVGVDAIESRPYRLMVPITADIDEVYEALDAGDVTAALDRYPGPLLPQSISPAVGRLRTELTMTLRAAVLSTGDPALLRRWLDSPDGRDDRDGWRALHDGTLPGSVQQAQARGKLAGLDFDLA